MTKPTFLITWYEQYMTAGDMIQLLKNIEGTEGIYCTEHTKAESKHFHARVDITIKGGSKKIKEHIRKYRKFKGYPIPATTKERWWLGRKGIDVQLVANYNNATDYIYKDGNVPISFSSEE